MNAAARPWMGIFFKCLSVLALIFAFVFFMRMQEEQSANDKLRMQGVVSRALVVDKEKDQVLTSHSSGRRGNSSYATSNDRWVLHVRHVPKSPVKYADYPARVKEADLPVAPPETGDPLKDTGYGGVIIASEALFDRTKVGDMITVANTPWDSTVPVPVAQIEAFDPAPFYPRMAIAMVLAVMFWLIGRRFAKARP